MKKEIKKSPVALAVLALLIEKPMHPYKMWQLIKERAKDEVVNVKYRASLYQTIDRLEQSGLIGVLEIRREEGRPEQTVYEITPDGRQTALKWMKKMLSEPAEEFPEFPVALAYLPMLSPGEVVGHLNERVKNLEKEYNRLQQQHEEYGDIIPRLFLLETEFISLQLKTEINWVSELISDLQEKRIFWSDEWLQEIASRFEEGA